MKKISKIALNSVDQNDILRKNQLKRISGGYITCKVYDNEGHLIGEGRCADPDASTCKESCDMMNIDAECICS